MNTRNTTAEDTPRWLFPVWLLGVIIASFLMLQYGQQLSGLGILVATVGLLLAYVWPTLILPIRNVLRHR